MRPGYIDSKDAVQKRLRRVEGQVRGLQRMVDEDRYCIDILEQVSAATKALQAVALELLDDHLAHCVSDAVRRRRRGDREAQRGLRRHQPAGPLLIPMLGDGHGPGRHRALARERASSCSGRRSGP